MKRSILVPYITLAGLFVLVIAYQVRISLDTVHLQTHLDLYVPFLLKPFSTQVESREHSRSWEKERRWTFRMSDSPVLRRGDEVLSVNGQPFTGFSLYLRELWRDQHPLHPPKDPKEWTPFHIVARAGDSRLKTIEFGWPHCTCGVPEQWEAIVFWLAAPLFTTVLGFAATVFRPGSILAWAWLALMLSLSQLQFWGNFYTGFQLYATPMLWPDQTRIPTLAYRSFVQSAWPSALVLVLVWAIPSRPATKRLALVVASCFAAFAAVQAALDVSWSENFRPAVWLYNTIDQAGFILPIAAFAAVTLLGWRADRRVGLAMAALSVVAVAALFWPPAPIIRGEWIQYSDNTNRFTPVMPYPHNTPGLIVVSFTSACVVAWFFAGRELARKAQLALGLLCLIPLAVHLGNTFGNLGWSDPGSSGWRWLVLGTAAAGLSILTAWIVAQAGRARSSA